MQRTNKKIAENKYMQSIELVFEFQLQTDRINEKIYFSLNLTFCLFSFVYLVIASIR